MKLNIKQVKRYLPPGNKIHTFRQADTGQLLGCDMRKHDLLKIIKQYGCQKAGKNSCSMNHGMATEDRVGFLFIETNDLFRTEILKE